MIVRLYSGEDGQAHFEEITGPWVGDHRCLLKPPSVDGGYDFYFERRAGASSLGAGPRPMVDGASWGLCPHA
jgi:hypothetical protein